MRKIQVILLSMTMAVLSACADYLDIVPDNVPTMEHAFKDRVSAERFLATIYQYMPQIGHPMYDPALLGSDEYGTNQNDYHLNLFHYWGDRMKLGEQNTNDPIMNYWEGRNDARNLYIALRDCNIFLENIGKVGPDLNDEDRARWIAEVKFLKAFYHFYLLRMYGPIPLVKENLPISSSSEEVRVYRDTFDDCVDYICQLCEEAIPDLPLSITDVINEMGRITRPIAATLLAEARVTGASPLFNGNPDFQDLTDNRGMKLFSEEDPNKWNVAAVACKEAVEICKEAGISQLYEFNDSRYDLSEETRRGMSIRGASTEKWNEELIWGNPVNTSAQLQQRILPCFKDKDWSHTSGPIPEVYPTFRMAELFYSQNGVPIEEDVNYDHPHRYQVVTVGDDHTYYIKKGERTAYLNLYREPRFYADLGFDRGYWFGNGRTKDVGKGTASETPWIVAAKKGQMSGKTKETTYSRSGYFCKKMVHFEAATDANGKATYARTTYPLMRLADLYLLYAEALNESLNEPNDEVYYYIDEVRKRAGLKGVKESWSNYSRNPDKPLTKIGMRDIIRQERMIELSFESKRFWDVRRWKLAHIYYNQVERGWNVHQSTEQEYYNVITVQPLQFTTKQYLWPIREAELMKNSNLIQNPYWD